MLSVNNLGHKASPRGKTSVESYLARCLQSLFCSHYYPCIPWRTQLVHHSSCPCWEPVKCTKHLSQLLMINRIVRLSHIDPAHAQISSASSAILTDHVIYKQIIHHSATPFFSPSLTPLHKIFLI